MVWGGFGGENVCATEVQVIIVLPVGDLPAPSPAAVHCGFTVGCCGARAGGFSLLFRMSSCLYALGKVGVINGGAVRSPTRASHLECEPLAVRGLEGRVSHSVWLLRTSRPTWVWAPPGCEDLQWMWAHVPWIPLPHPEELVVCAAT